MDRRNFLKSIAAISAAGLLAGHLPTEAAARTGGALFKSGPLGQILTSHDDGRTWHVSASFGPQYRVLEITQPSVASDALEALIGYQEHTFRLRSDDGRTWHTV